jgi:hypothetical protein
MNTLLEVGYTKVSGGQRATMRDVGLRISCFLDCWISLAVLDGIMTGQSLIADSPHQILNYPSNMSCWMRRLTFSEEPPGFVHNQRGNHSLTCT